MADAIRPGGVYYVGGRLENGKPTGGRWLDANGNETDAPTSAERKDARQEAAAAEQAHQEAVAAQRAAGAQPVAVVEAPTRRGR
jgi:hypothetical protein